MVNNKAVRRIEWIKRFALEKPVVFSILVFLTAGLVTEIPLSGILLPLAGSSIAARFLEGIILQVGVGLILVDGIVKLGLRTQAGFTLPRQWRALWLVWPLAGIAVLNLSPLLDGSLTIDTSRPGLIALYICLVLSIGFLEETLGRGLILSVILRKWGTTRQGIYRAMFVSGAIFGIFHIFNLCVGRLPFLANMTQIIYSFFFGVIFAACLLRNNAIWPVIIMHAAIDFGGDMLRDISIGDVAQTAAVTNSTFGEAAISILITLPLLLYGIFILRKVTSLTDAGNMGEDI